MRKLSLLFLVIAMLASVSAAQKRRKVPVPVAPTPQTIIVQDDAGEGFMVFDLGTGAYKCKVCEYGYIYSGVGSVKMDGCLVFFAAAGDGYSITASVSLCEQMGKCFIQVSKSNGVDIEPWEEVLSDPYLRDSQASCGTTTPPPPELPAEVILQNDLDGSFLFLATATGEFKFTQCTSNIAMSGVGKVTMSGPWLNFEAITNEYRVLASVNLDAKSGKAVIDVFVPIGEIGPMQEIISDANYTDNVPQCGVKK